MRRLLHRLARPSASQTPKLSSLLTKRSLATLCLAAGFVVLPGFRKATMELPVALASESGGALTVEGHNPRRWGKPLAFGGYRTATVHEGAEFSWGIPAFGGHGGTIRQRYQLALEGPAGRWEIECRARSIEYWRNGLTVEITDAFTPRLVCGVHDPDNRTWRFVLASDGIHLLGQIDALEGHSERIAVRSIHRLAGSRWPMQEPVGYVLEGPNGQPLAAVETLNTGRVWLTAQSATGATPAVLAALLLYQAELEVVKQ